ncbi:hypothetical protein P2W68_19750 [Chryseobacterium arthrosphaerae]|uniref:hypothetical protein n=1 Tax=Chryseobacterium arthrosphaerae TaxID=651561 RepID=UPI0023E1F99F|nr:hypothetical protein [Chryseobacterium arthrosphaerae]WES97060.1 hypothetical protein P2W68_19750 [Chryseobacterium arthrosphaerae]
MGIGFVILIHLVILFILCLIFAVIAGIVAYLVSNKNRRRRKIILAIAAPFVGLYTFYICGIIGFSLVTDKKKVDIGIGDAWYVPLRNNHQLLFIDIPEQASINGKNGETQVSMVAEIEEDGNKILGKTFDNGYFLLDTATDEVKTFNTEKELIAVYSGKKTNLAEVTEFYSERKDRIMGLWPFCIGFLSLVISGGAVYILKLIIDALFGKVYTLKQK